MNISTLKKSFALAILLAGATGASAQTFLYEGIVYKASGSKLTAQKPTVKPENGDAPGKYDGAYVIPEAIEYKGKNYTVTSIAGVFKNEGLTSIELPSTVTTISRGCFQGCTNLTKAVLPSTLATMNGDLFNGCTALTEISIPGTVKELASNQFKGCTALTKVTIEDGETALEFSSAAFGDGGPASCKEFIINRQIGSKYTDMATKPFRGNGSIETITIGGSFKDIPASYFEAMGALKTINLGEQVTSLGTNIFAGSVIEEVVLPAGVTAVPASAFQNCKQLRKVTLGANVARIEAMAFYNSSISEIALPEALTSIGQMAFSGANISGDLVLPGAVKSIGLQAYANNTNLTSVSIPATASSIGDGAFMGCTGIAKYTVAADCEAYANDAENKAIISKDGETILAYAPAAEGTVYATTAKTVAPYAFYRASKLEAIDVPEAMTIGDYAFCATAIKTLNVKGAIGRYIAKDCAALTELTVHTPEIPFGIAEGCANLEKVNLDDKITVVKQEAFKGCAKLAEINLGNILSIIEAGAFDQCGVKTMTVGAHFPAAMAEGVFTEANADITVKVPVDLVDTYKAAAGWKYLNITGDANLAEGGADMGMPEGLYYAGVDGKLHCVYEQGEPDTYDVGGVPHTFQLIQFKNRIYGASAGQKFVYSATGSVDGDGKLFYISKVGGETFQAVVLDNTGNNAYKDPFGLYIYGETLYVNDRNVCIRKISADAIALPQDYASWMENNWMAFYGAEWSYGCIKSGFAITQDEDEKGEPEPLYWVGMKYNGNGIFRFKEKNIGTSSSEVGPRSEYAPLLCALNPIFTAFYVDEANNQLYIYMEKAGTKAENLVKAGLYRIELSKLAENPDPSDWSMLDAQLIDGSPVKYEGSAANEHVGIPQFSVDEKGEYLYWCYRAPTPEEAVAQEEQSYEDMLKGKYYWADKYDENNPLHHSGIKRIKLGEANPTVEMVAPGVEGYGIVPVNYEGSKKPGTGVNAIVSAPEAAVVTVSGDMLTAIEATPVAIFNAAGAMVAYTELAAGETMSLETLESGVYVIAAGKQTVKIVK